MKSWLFFIGLVAAVSAFAQHHPAQDSPVQAQLPRSGYAGLQDSGIKALSKKKITDLRPGKGMALALPAELNG